MKKILTLIIFILCLQAKAQAPNSELYRQSNPDKMSATDIKGKSEGLSFDAEVLKDFNSSLGVNSDAFFTLRDRNRISLGYHISSNYNDFSEFSAFEFTFFQNLRNWQGSWWGIMFKKGSADFKAVSQNATEDVSKPGTAEAHPDNQRPDEAQQDLTILGIGMAHRFKFILDFIDNKRLYEQVNWFITYNRDNDGFTNNSYSGPGLVADYEIFKRSSQRMYYGWKLSYHLASVGRSVEDGERNREGRLTLSWVSMGFNIGYYY